jgi:hypothetical protein
MPLPVSLTHEPHPSTARFDSMPMKLNSPIDILGLAIFAFVGI